MKINQNDFERIKDKLGRGLISSDQANVEMVLCQRVRIVTNSIPADVRKALNAAVKEGKLGRIAKKNGRNEAYFHPSFDYLARSEIEKLYVNKMKNIATVLGS